MVRGRAAGLDGYTANRVTGGFAGIAGIRLIPKLLLIALLLAHASTIAAEPKKKAGPALKDAAEQKQFIEKHFEHWDSNHDGSLDLKEANELIQRGMRSTDILPPWLFPSIGV